MKKYYQYLLLGKQNIYMIINFISNMENFKNFINMKINTAKNQ